MEVLTLFHPASAFRLGLGVVYDSDPGLTRDHRRPSVAKPMDSKLSILKKNEAIYFVFPFENDRTPRAVTTSMGQPA